jgi:hypothetical protein
VGRTSSTIGRLSLVAAVALGLGACSGDTGSTLAAPTSVPVTTTAAPGTAPAAAPALAAATTCRELLDVTEPQLGQLLDALLARAAALQPADLVSLSIESLPEFQRFAEGTANLEAEATRVNCTDAEQQARVCDVLAAASPPTPGAGGELVLQLLRASC